MSSISEKTYLDIETIVREGFEKGLSDNDIAKQLGISVYQVKRIRRKLGLYKRKRIPLELLAKAAKGVISEREIAEQFGVSISSVVNQRRALGFKKRDNYKLKISPEELKALSESMSDAEIAMKYGATVDSIKYLRHKLGIKKKVRKKYPEIPREDLIEITRKWIPDRVLADRYRVPIHHIRIERRKLGILKPRGKITLRFMEVVEGAKKLLDERGYITSRDLRERFNYSNYISVFRHILRRSPECGFMRLRIKSTSKYSVFQMRTPSAFIYKPGAEEKLAEFLVSHLVKPPPPKKSLSRLLKTLKIPEKIMLEVLRLYDAKYSKTVSQDMQ